jgi:hypothetical protein
VVAIQSYLGAVGIQVELEFPEAAKWQTYRTGTWNNGLLYETLAQYPNFNTFYSLYFTLPNNYYKSLDIPAAWADLYAASYTSPKPDGALLQKCVQYQFDQEMGSCQEDCVKFPSINLRRDGRL